MIRVNIIVEGQTEETFVRDVLAPHLGNLQIVISVRCVETGRKNNKIFRGGMTSYLKAKRDLLNWIKQDRNAYFTTMFDLYRLPGDFPGMKTTERFADPYQRVAFIEREFALDINEEHFIPYIQLHEFEALLLTEPSKFNVYYFDRSKEIKILEQLCAEYQTPEHINDGEDTAPSKRIANLIPEYTTAKDVAGPIIAQAIGLTKLRYECRHFNEWLERLENLRLL
ncbi:hypothetical protein B0537_08900 [Desulforamulus ferrireducens]|uniref:DUF4276 family protein n=2 Tax=Desulforamulus ferrireducens TaxID=1833852 RepID=A0A1S6IWN4_9FIRM|nr:hypothetical protein B0537_08900 [Desulforamulus ferrireducens]